jgi:DNA-binding Lrp family transcriptional regulator
MKPRNEELREVSIRAILRELKKDQPQITATIAKRTGLSQTTVTRRLEDLLEEGRIREKIVGRTRLYYVVEGAGGVKGAKE